MTRQLPLIALALLAALCMNQATSASDAPALAAPATGNLLPPQGDWTAVRGKRQIQDGVSVLQPGSELQRVIKLNPGVYELQVTGSGSGLLSVAAAGTRRTLRVANQPGVYGLLFELTQAQEVTLALTYHEGGSDDRFQLQSTALMPADAQQLAAWSAAKESFKLLGYFGTDPQRPAPGAGAASAARTVTPQDLERWAIQQTVVFYDAGYDPYWVEDVDSVVEYFTRRGVPAKNAVELEAWLKERAQGDAGVGTSLIFAMGVAPSNVVYPPFVDCLLARYLRAGGRAVWLANVPMYVSQGAKGPVLMYGTKPGEEMLGLTTDRKSFYGLNGPTITSAGQAWGLEPGLRLSRPVHSRSVTVPLVTDPTGEYCGVGLVNLRGDLPFSGFILVPDPINKHTVQAMLPNAYRLARYVGKPVTIPAPAPLPPPQVPLKASLRFGTQDLRMVYLRGETVPLVLRAQSLGADLGPVAVRYTLREGDRTLVQNELTVTIASKESDQLVGQLDLAGLRVGSYGLNMELKVKDKSMTLQRELRLGPEPDHDGLHYGIWCHASPRVNRTQDLLEELAGLNLQPMFVDDLPVGQDLSLWYGMSYSTRRHGEPDLNINPPGYNNDRLGSSGQVMRVMSLGDQRISKGYSSPFRRQAEADDFGRQVKQDGLFPAFCRRSVTADDYSQFLGLDYNRFAVEGFRARYGIDAPKPTGTEDPRGTPGIDRDPGIVPDDDPWLLLNEYWCRTFGDAGRRYSLAMSAATQGQGKVGPVPGGMQLPVMTVGCGQYPPFAFGTQGFSMSSFYYYNSFWQPPLVHWWWLEVARMGNRDIEQWMMPDSYQMHLESFYRNNAWLILAGGVQGMDYFCYDERKPEAIKAMSHFGGLAQRYGLLMRQVRPAPKKLAMLVPFENITYVLENNYQMAFPFLNMLLAKIDVEPVSPEELNPSNIHRWETVLLAQTQYLKASTVELLENYIAAGGKVLMDRVSAAAIPIKGAIHLDVSLGDTHNGDYAQPETIARVRAALAPHCPPVVDCNDPQISLRRSVLPDGTPALWAVHNYTQDEFARLRAGKDSAPEAARELEKTLGFGRDVVNATITRADDGRIPFDVFGRRQLKTTRADGVMEISIDMPKWQGMLIVMLPALPKDLAIDGLPAQTTPGVALRLGVRVHGPDGKPLTAPLPLQLTVRDPQGEASREYARRLLTSQGSAARTFAFAVNDARGLWTVEVEDLLTGVKTTRTVTLK